MVRPLIIAIDGPSGVGKGTVARRVAAALGYRHVDTGVMYRVVGWCAIGRGFALDDEAAVASIASEVAIETVEGRVLADGVDVTRDIRTPEIDHASTTVARLPRVRAALVERQRAMGRSGGVVMEGRDIGTVVFPDADLKIFLDATAEERARRRAADQTHADAGKPVAEVAGELSARDCSDRTRAASPLVVAEGAIVIDTTSLTIDEVVGRVLEQVESRRRPGSARSLPFLRR